MSTRTSTCPACTALRVVQCNKHRKTAPNAGTLKQRKMLAYIRETGCTPAEAEAHFGITGHVTIGR